MSFYICDCGNSEKNHNYRHPFYSTCKVYRNIDDSLNEYYTINCDDFKTKSGEKCELPNCESSKKIHQTVLIPHAYQPKQFFYRDINFAIPLDTICRERDCKTLEKHENLEHAFKTKVIFKNKKETDRLNIFHPLDEDIKIVLEN